MRESQSRPPLGLAATVLVAALVGCSDTTNPANDQVATPSECIVDGDRMQFSGVSRDGIPALTNPDFVLTPAPEAEYISDDDRVIGFRWHGAYYAIPHNILYYHEIVNLDGIPTDIAVSYCPLTGTSIAFDRGNANGAEFGVSGLLFRNNLVMYDRSAGESLWPQMMGSAGCGPARGVELEPLPVLETTWAGWKELHPNSIVMSEETGFDTNYQVNPYQNYEIVNTAPLFNAETVDPRRQPKERVLGISDGAGGGIALPFFELDNARAVAINLTVGDAEVVALWERDLKTARAYDPVPVWSAGMEDPPEGPVTFRVESGKILDNATGSQWRVNGEAVAGPAAGSHLTPHPGSVVAFWFAWASFNPQTELLVDF